jgi:hypothetical protein
LFPEIADLHPPRRLYVTLEVFLIHDSSPIQDLMPVPKLYELDLLKDKGGSKMIRWMRSARMARGNAMKVLAWSKEIAEYVKKYEGLSSIDVFLDAFGDSGTVRWIVDYEDLATLEKVMNQLMGDQGYWKKIEEAQSFFIEGSVHDIVMRGI